MCYNFKNLINFNIVSKKYVGDIILLKHIILLDGKRFSIDNNINKITVNLISDPDINVEPIPDSVFNAVTPDDPAIIMFALVKS